MVVVRLSILFGEMSLLIPYSFLNWVLCLFIWSCKKFFLSAISFALKYNPVAPSVKVSWIASTDSAQKCVFFHICLSSLFWWQSATPGLWKHPCKEVLCLLLLVPGGFWGFTDLHTQLGTELSQKIRFFPHAHPEEILRCDLPSFLSQSVFNAPFAGRGKESKL